MRTKDAIYALKSMIETSVNSFHTDALDMAIKTLEAQQWIPVKIRPMTTEERKYYSDHWGMDVEYYDAVMFDGQMPNDGQTVWVTTKCGNVFQDVCEDDDGYIGLEGNGYWDDIVAWMPVYVPEPYVPDTNVGKNEAEWISISERLPKDGQQVRIRMTNGYEDEITYNSSGVHDHIVEWMPSPKK